MAIHDLRTYLAAVRGAGEIHEIRRPVDPVRELGAVLRACERADKAAFFHAVRGFDVPVVGGLLSSPRRIALALECDVADVNARMAAATERPIAPAPQDGPAPCQEIVVETPDLTRWPIPTHSPLDAGPVVTALTCDVLVPAWAEIVLEGEVLAGARELEGPMAEFTGHYSGADPKHVARITTITHRASPIMQTMNGGGYEHVSLGNMITREPLLARFVRHITRKLKAVHLPPYAAGFTAIISLERPDPGEARNVAIAAMAAHVNIKA